MNLIDRIASIQRGLRIVQTDVFDPPAPLSPLPKPCSVPPPESSRSLQEARDFVRRHEGEGVECPCCGHYNKLYRRKLNAGMAKALLLIYAKTRHDTREWLEINRILREDGINIIALEYSKLRYWGLLEQNIGDASPNTKQGSGLWRLTELGRRFVRKAVRVPKYVLLRDGIKIGHNGEDIDIDQALGEKFDYDEMIRDSASCASAAE